MSVVAIHQPNYLPWIGFFHKLGQVDEVVILNSVEYSHRSYTNRARIRGPSGWQYLSIPISRTERFKKINEVLLPENSKWKEKHWKAIKLSYSNTPHFREFEQDFSKVFFEREFKYLWEFNFALINLVLNLLDLKPKIVFSSDLNVGSYSKSELILEVCKQEKADVYLSGQGAKEYLEKEQFDKFDIILEFQGFEHPVYKQRFPGFEQGMSIIDLIFNEGLETTRAICLSGKNDLSKP